MYQRKITKTLTQLITKQTSKQIIQIVELDSYQQPIGYKKKSIIDNQKFTQNLQEQLQQQPDKSIEQLISRKKSVNLTISDSNQNQKRTIEKCDWLIRPGKIHVDRKQIKQIRHETIFRETFNRLNGWQIDNDNDTEF